MNRMRLQFTLLCALGLTWCTAWAAPGSWLIPSAAPTENRYTFDTVGQTFDFPTASYKEWSVLNAASTAAEVAKAYTIAEDTDGTYLPFTSSGALAEDKSAYLALGIRSDDAGNAFVMAPATGAKMRVDNVYAKVRFVPTSEIPDSETLKEMYPSYADRDAALQGEFVPRAIKLGVFVNESGYFCVSRARFSSDVDAGDTGTAKDYVYEFVPSKYTYNDVGGGAVVIRIEFHTYSDAAGLYTRLFRIWAQNAADATAKEVCLTEGLGCPWNVEPIQGTDPKQYAYRYNFKQIGTGDYFPAWDAAVALEQDLPIDVVEEVDTLNQLAFSATSGGFYEAWIVYNDKVTDFVTLNTAAQTMSLAGFEPYLEDVNSAAFSLYTDWATRYNVNLESYFGGNASPMSLGAENTAIEYAYNAFLLDMDPAVDVTQSLTVTGLSPDATQILMTVYGPEGAKLAELKAAKLCIKRAATPDGLDDDDAYTVRPSFTADAQGNLIFELPTQVDGNALPFMKVLLEPRYQ